MQSPRPEPKQTGAPAVEAKPKKKLTIVDVDDDFEFRGDLDKIAPPKILGGGPTYTMSQERTIEAIGVLNASWTASRTSMIPHEAQELFPVGPTPGPYRSNHVAPQGMKRSKRLVETVRLAGEHDN